jgi:hypothetical protein
MAGGKATFASFRRMLARKFLGIRMMNAGVNLTSYMAPMFEIMTSL